MAQLIITVPDDKVVEIRDAVCEALNYNPASGLTKIEFVRQQLIKFLKVTYSNHVAEKAAATARQTTATAANQVVIT